MILKMGNLAQLANMRSHTCSTHPLQTSVDELTVRVTTCEGRYWEASKVMTLKVEVEELRKDVNYLKSIDFNLLIEAVDDEDAPETSKIPPATTGEESDVETNEEMIEHQEESLFRDLPDLVETVVQPVIQTSLTETSTTTPIIFGTTIPSEVTLGIDAQISSTILGTDAQLERVIPSHYPIHSARESEWAKAKAVLNAATQYSREIKLIRDKLLEREFTPTIV
ncbi:hypothetical protein H5410_051438 [Solanum commersonii]|uniref:Polyprotein protein n=1 Tax=Solanum commersonii TaxID=4109 RepID=A0A9J5WYE6_SOLCO|nr:hypothetical protein H5410_051438 [Solanum commersonii]